MKVGQIRNLIEGLGDDEEIACFWYDKSDANDYVYNNMKNGDSQPEITDEEWSQVVTRMAEDEGVWNETSESFSYAMNQIEVQRDKTKGETNDNSK